MTKPSTTSVSGTRTLTFGTARGTLLDVFGEFALEGPPPPTSVLVTVLGEMGIGHHAVRQAIRRCATAGWIVGARENRESRWELTDKGRELLSDGIARVEALGTDFDEWDGTWLIVVSTIPKEKRSVRERFYVGLRWNGFGSPMPGLWVSAHPERRDAVRRTIARCGLEQTTACFSGSTNGLGLPDDEMVALAWDLDQLSDRYQELVDRFATMEPVGQAQSLTSLLELNKQLQSAPAWDPQLPSSLVPDWPGRRAVGQLLTLRQQWLGPAREYWEGLQS